MGTMTNVKTAYTPTEWNNREAYYIAAVDAINIPPDPSTGDIKRITSEIDSILSEALLDFAYIRRNFERYDSLMKLSTTEAFGLVKAALPAGTKMTEAEVKAQVVTHLKNNPLQGTSRSVYELVANCEERHIFMSEIVRILEGKKGALVTDNAMLKIENSMGGNSGGNQP